MQCDNELERENSDVGSSCLAHPEINLDDENVLSHKWIPIPNTRKRDLFYWWICTECDHCLVLIDSEKLEKYYAMTSPEGYPFYEYVSCESVIMSQALF